MNYLNAIYEKAIEENDINEMTEIKEQLDNIYKDKARKQVDKIRNIELTIMCMTFISCKIRENLRIKIK